MTDSGPNPIGPNESSDLESGDVDNREAGASAELDEMERQQAWLAFEAADALLAKAQAVRNMPPPSTVAEMRNRERLILDLEAQANATRPPPATTGKPIPQPQTSVTASLHERLRGTGVQTGAESPSHRRARRAVRFAELGGSMRKAGNGWQALGKRGALADLVLEEKTAGRPMADRKNVKADLIAALEDRLGS